MNAARQSTVTPPARGLSPRNLARLGNLLRARPLEAFAALRDAGPLIRYRLGGRVLYVANDPELVYQILVKHGEAIIRGTQFEKLKPLMGDGLLTTDNATHRRNRPIVNPSFHRDKINSYVAVMAEEADRRASEWHDGQTLDLQTEGRKNALTVAARCLSMTDLADRVATDVEKHFPRFLDGLNPRAMLPRWAGDHLPGNRHFVSSVAYIRETLAELVAHHEKLLADDAETAPSDLVTGLLTASNPDTGERLSAAQVSDEVVTLFVAATDTTSNTLAFAWRVLGDDPDLAARVRAEADAAFGEGPADLATVGRLELTHRVVKEVLRKYTPPWLVTRKVVADVDVDGPDGTVYRLPAGAELVFSPWAIHRNPAVYPDPERFDPDRWLPERAKSIPRHSWLPFGAGRRKCIGEAFAELEVTMTLAVWARRWLVEPTAKKPVRPVPSATLRPDDARAVVRSR
ncbi:cytochrome P450 [Phytomonospora endophytica]|uniref:Cytochrome P450 n=1 Tax=Phytomonospora endophytica TaxID=714109 RepID=A0A841FBA1_9ACTN|nr:cytochrome P450 [Phytomonospora endophytica]MBB6032585.1 cytochrome P450 [Phytomonospora endophytica]